MPFLWRRKGEGGGGEVSETLTIHLPPEKALNEGNKQNILTNCFYFLA